MQICNCTVAIGGEVGMTVSKERVTVPELALLRVVREVRRRGAREVRERDLDDVVRVLEEEGVDKFVASWIQLLESVTAALDAARPAAG